ncbi:putative splicing factor 3A subunit 1 [Carex littledalei]|uniref:Putative splicing factor 3A subunit 1 n=1 Tax=Carex littledalei TaxID=544730 RepID=A0A833VWQ7_9POAL|nr:putative splicing factor 3A subunit 1 [Carex littledalei]
MLALTLPAPSSPDPTKDDSSHDPQSERPDPDSSPKEQPPAPVATHTRTIGIIHPPPDIKAIVEKTAQYVAKNGSDFERQILAKNAGNPKFNFLISSDPYHAYYQNRVSEHKIQLENVPAAGAAPTDTASKPDDSNQLGPGSTQPSTNEEFRAPPKKILEPPPSEVYTVRLPEGITGEELDVIKLTAQFVARNGKSFMEKLIKRVDVSSPQFHFLRPTHSMYTFFTSLADAYSKVLMPEKGLTDKLREKASGLTVVLERCLHRLEWEKSQEQARQRAEDETEQERMQMAMIDWHDFIVVETIEFAEEEDEELPIPMTLEDVIRRSKLSALEETELPIEAAEPGKEMEIDMDEEEIQLVQEGMRAARLDDKNADGTGDGVPEVKPPTDEPMQIVKNWKRPENGSLLSGTRQILVVLCGKRLIGLIRSNAAKGSPLPAAFTPLRIVHTTTYDKNIDEVVVQPTVVPDHVIGNQPETYWGPHPHTGVFGPAGRTIRPIPKAGAHKAANGPSVLDQEAWFRPVEGVDKPAPP